MKNMKKPIAIIFACVIAAIAISLACWWAVFAVSNSLWLKEINSDPYVRAFALADVNNVRDCGGWPTSFGKRVLHGRLYRSAELNNTDSWHPNRHFTLSEPSKAFFTDILRIRTDIDLRNDHECAGMTGSPLGTNVLWRHISSHAYANIGTKVGKEAFAEVFRTLLDPGIYPVVIHCRVGRDRVGSTVFLLNALLGVSERDLRRDYEYTERTKWNSTFKYGLIDEVMDVLSEYPGDTVNARAEALVRSLGFGDADIKKFKSIMLGTK